MACRFEVNTIKTFQTKGVFGQDMTLYDPSRFDRLNKEYSDFARKKYDIKSEENLFTLHNDGERFVVTPNKDFFNQVEEGNKDNPLFEIDMDFFENNTVPDNVKFGLDLYLDYKENLLERAERSIRDIRIQEKILLQGEATTENIRALRELTKRRKDLEDRVEGSEDIIGLKEQVDRLKAATSFDIFSIYALNDFHRFEELMKNPTIDNITEAKILYDFYANIDNFSAKSNNTNPLFEDRDLFPDSDRELNMSEEAIQYFQRLAAQMRNNGNKIESIERKKIVEIINSNKNMQDTFNRELSYEDLFHTDNGLKDITWIDLWMMDITNGIFSNDGVVPQVMMTLLQNSVDANVAYAVDVSKRMDDMQGDLTRELNAIKSHSQTIIGKYPSYEIFRALDEHGSKTEDIIGRFSKSYSKAMGKIFGQFREAMAEARSKENPGVRNREFDEADKNLKKKLKENTVMFDIRKIPAIINDPQFSEFSGFFKADVAAEYEKFLIDLLGEQGYAEEVEKQKRLLKSFNTMREITIDEFIVRDGVSSKEELTKRSKAELDLWEKRNNPFLSIAAYYGNAMTHGGRRVNTGMRYNHYVPRRYKMEIGGDNMLRSTSEETGFYDKNFEMIEGNETLKKFHNLLVEVQQVIYDLVPEDKRNKFGRHSLPAMKKGLLETLLDKDTGILQKISEAFRLLIEKIQELFGERIENSFSVATLNSATGKPDYKVNSSFLKSNKGKISDRTYIELQRMKSALNIPHNSKLEYGSKHDISGNREAIELLAEILEVAPTREAIEKRLSGQKLESIELVNAIRSGVTHQIVSESSFDLPKILKAYTYSTMVYAARQEALPILNIMKEHYNIIKNPAVTRSGEPIMNVSRNKKGEEEKSPRFDGEREKANRRMESWFKRAVLGDYSSKNELGDTTIKGERKVGVTGNEKIDKALERFQFTITGNLLNREDKALRSKIRGLENSIDEDIKRVQDRVITTKEQKKKAAKDLSELETIKGDLENMDNQIGLKFSFKSVIDGLFSMVRFLGLGWNIPAYLTNFLEGQVANMTVAASGDLFTPENIYRANSIVQGSIVRNYSFGHMSPGGSKKASILMKRYDVLQDASNEMQKASHKTAYSKLAKLGPYEGVTRTEYLNQTPLMIAILLDRKVKDENGENEISVWDAMNDEGEFIEGYDTEENISNWIDRSGEDYFTFKNHINKAIVLTHGDYDTLRGNLSTEYISGKTILMFKRWMGRQFYQRFAKEQSDIELGIKDYKGRWRSHTQVSGALHGAILGFGGLTMFSLGPMGAALGALVGFGGGLFHGPRSKNQRQGIEFLKEAAFITKELFLNIARMPLNSLAGRQIIKDSDYGIYKDVVEERDVKNLRSNLIEMSINLVWLGFALLIKGLLWDDDDDKDSTNRKAYHIVTNRLMMLSKQASMYGDPVEIYNNVVAENAMLRFLRSVGETVGAAANLLSGDDLILSGPNAGESKFEKQFKKTFFPRIANDLIGFGTASDRLFFESPFDNWFRTPDTHAEKDRRELKLKALNQYINNKMSDKEREIMQKKIDKFYRKHPKESQQEALKRVQEGFDPKVK